MGKLRDLVALRRALTRSWFERKAEDLLSATARRLPRRLRYWTWMSVTVDATSDPALRRMEIPGVPLNDLLRVSHQQLMRHRSRRELERIARAAHELWDNRLGWSDGRSPYAPRELWSDLAEALGVDPLLVSELRDGANAVPSAKMYPYEEGDVLVIGPECFIGRRSDTGARVISYQGENFEVQPEPELEPARRGADGGA